MATKIKVEENLINFYTEDREELIYSIPKSDLEDTIEEHGHIISDWINQLMIKDWINDKVLYEIAVLIKKEFPENNIDWFQTFFPVEKKGYLEHVKNTKRIISEEKPKTSFDSLVEIIKMGQEENNEEVNGEVTEIVKKNLNRYDLK